MLLYLAAMRRNLIDSVIESLLKAPDYSYTFLDRELKLAERAATADLRVELMAAILAFETHLDDSQLPRCRKRILAYLQKYARRV